MRLHPLNQQQSQTHVIPQLLDLSGFDGSIRRSAVSICRWGGGSHALLLLIHIHYSPWLHLGCKSGAAPFTRVPTQFLAHAVLKLV